MESKWRLNYWELGLNGTEPSLYARVLSTTDLYVTTFMPKTSPNAHLVRVRVEPPGSLTEGQIVFDDFFPLKPNGANSDFPYGFVTEPDHV